MNLAASAPLSKSLSFHQTEYGVPNYFLDGFGSAKSKIETTHPLEQKLKNDNRFSLDPVEMSVLRNTQGLHAPLRLAAELKATLAVGRLPFLPSSNLAAATLTGRDDSIDFNDFLNPIEFNEKLVNPQCVMEYKLGIL